MHSSLKHCHSAAPITHSQNLSTRCFHIGTSLNALLCKTRLCVFLRVPDCCKCHEYNNVFSSSFSFVFFSSSSFFFSVQKVFLALCSNPAPMHMLVYTFLRAQFIGLHVDAILLCVLPVLWFLTRRCPMSMSHPVFLWPSQFFVVSQLTLLVRLNYCQLQNNY